MKTILNLTPFQLQKIVERHWSGESLPSLADEYHIDRVQLFNFKTENRLMWKGIENNIIQSEIRSLIHADERDELSDRDNARVQLCMFLLKNLPQRGTRAYPFRDYIVENMMRFKNDDTDKKHLFHRAEIDQLEDAKAAVALFETHFNVTLLESPPHRTTLQRSIYHV